MAFLVGGVESTATSTSVCLGKKGGISRPVKTSLYMLAMNQLFPTVVLPWLGGSGGRLRGESGMDERDGCLYIYVYIYIYIDIDIAICV